MKKIINEDLLKIIISTILFIIALFLPNPFKLIVLIISYIIISYEIYIEAFNELKEKEIFNENLLMILATIGAFVIGSY